MEVATIVATSSKLKVEFASFFGSTPTRRTAPLAIAFNATITGRNTVATATNGVARMSTARSGTENEMFLGTISPSTTCRNDTITSVMMKAIVPVTSTFQPVRCSGPSSRWWMAGSDTLRISRLAMVMPSCVAASICVACSMA